MDIVKIILVLAAVVISLVIRGNSRGIDTSEITRRLQTRGITVETVSALWFYLPAPKDWAKFMQDRFSGPSRVYRVIGTDREGRRRSWDMLINPSVTFEPQILKSQPLE